MAKNSDNKEKKIAKSSGFKDFKAELKKVVWPTPKELVNSTAAVISIVVITAIIVLILDIAFDLLNTYGINKIRNAYSSSVQSSEAEDDANNGATKEQENEENKNSVEENNVTTTDTNVVDTTEGDATSAE